MGSSLYLEKGDEMSNSTDTTFKDLIHALSSYNDLSRVEARKALVAMGKQAVPALIEALEDLSSHHLLRWEAAKALGEIGAPEAAPTLVNALEDKEFDVRWLAAKGLIEMNVRALRPLLKELIERADSVLFRQGAHHVLHDLAKGELRIDLVPVLIAMEGAEPGVHVPLAASHAIEMLENAKII